MPDPHANQPVYTAGQPLDQAKAAMILIHGRGATASSILSLAHDLYHENMIYLAPQAADYTWYPQRFLAPLADNEPFLSSALGVIAGLVERVTAVGIPADKIVIGGFSQGACLAAEFVARHARRYGGVFVLSGGLIGPPDTPRSYAGALDNTPIVIGCGDQDTHIPLDRVEETAAVFTGLGAQVTQRLYANLGHTIHPDEIEQARQIVMGAY
jgi:predicted esterase